MTVFFNVLTFTSLPDSSLREMLGNASPTPKTPPFELVAAAAGVDSGLAFFVFVESSLSGFDFGTGAVRFLLLDGFAASVSVALEVEGAGGAARFAIREDVLLVASVVDMVQYKDDRFLKINDMILKTQTMM